MFNSYYSEGVFTIRVVLTFLEKIVSCDRIR